MKIGWFIRDGEDTFSYGKHFSRLANLTNSSVIYSHKVPDLKTMENYDYVIMDDYHVYESYLKYGIKATMNSIPYVQTLFGLNTLRFGKRGFKWKIPSFLPFPIIAKKYKEAIMSCKFRMSASIPHRD